MNYYMQYLKTANVNLVKDMGMIPYKLYENYGYNSTVVTFKNGEYPYLNKEVKGLNIEFVENKFNSYTIDGGLYLLKNSKKIDFLQIFHVTLSSFVYAYIYKHIQKKGKLYLKLDSSHKLVERIDGLNGFAKKILRCFFNKVDYISIEQDQLYFDLLERLPYIKEKFFVLKNGVDFKALQAMKLDYNYDEKKNIILSVARIGTEEKNTMMLMEAFAAIKDIEKTDWELHLVGPIEESFSKEIEDFFTRYKKLQGKVKFLGNIEDRYELYKKYREAKIFSLTSEFESFGIAFIEAAAFGDVIVSTDVGIVRELIKNNNGSVVNIGDTEALTNKLTEYISKESLKEESLNTYKCCLENFNWDKIVKDFYEKINIFNN
ncbi:Glycosyltransferase involved in cell wall bisynthesis [Clostridium cavendishii DSM 21758]|uniref:Glycosyltransferase involved in cell wall bisynthesis n=1 Tax=Clostridium cavendishii DSM 21758 TaxID=1121302 RepID=A0A1M6KQU3_9CLOT|nr:glycosyltransferase family 4 protein [Clostridium cavendishii]SHJ61305.1 Glycosyltransferase involved in cell wall bisynthesis [Clostridium cavendishii DSM 21758]